MYIRRSAGRSPSGIRETKHYVTSRFFHQLENESFESEYLQIYGRQVFKNSQTVGSSKQEQLAFISEARNF